MLFWSNIFAVNYYFLFLFKSKSHGFARGPSWPCKESVMALLKFWVGYERSVSGHDVNSSRWNQYLTMKFLSEPWHIFHRAMTDSSKSHNIPLRKPEVLFLDEKSTQNKGYKNTTTTKITKSTLLLFSSYFFFYYTAVKLDTELFL